MLDNCGPSFLIFSSKKKSEALFVSISLLIPLTNPQLFSQSFPVIGGRLCLSVSHSSHAVSSDDRHALPSQSPVLFLLLMNSWILLFPYKCWICLINPAPFEGCQLVLSTHVSFLRLLSFSFFSPHPPLSLPSSSSLSPFLHKEKETHFVNKPPRSSRLKTSTSPSLPALLPTGLCKTQLNPSPLNFPLQCIKREPAKRG